MKKLTLLFTLMICCPCFAASGYKVLHPFQYDPDGANPMAGLVLGKNGDFYGVTLSGGMPVKGCGCDGGTVFVISRYGKEKVLYRFTGEADGYLPLNSLTMDHAGNFYGTTSSGGADGGGTIFKITPKGKLTTLYAFQGPPNDVYDASSPLLIDAQGNLYGVGLGGSGSNCGNYGCGAVFEFSADGTESILYNFSGSPDGEGPKGPIVLSNGILYGTTAEGGDSSCDFEGSSGCGVLYSLDLVKGGESILSTFEANTGGFPTGLMTDGQGNFYGTTHFGGTFGTDGGVLFEFSPGQTGWNESVLYDFGGTNDGYWPTAGLLLDAEGDVFGTTQRSTQNLVDGTVFEITPSGQETIIHSFAALRYGNNKAPQGADPYAGVITDKTGNLYGTTEEGGNYHACDGGCGVVFRVER